MSAYRKKTSAILEKEEALEKWIGQPKSELLEVYGLPTEVRKNDQGIEFLIYTSKKFGIIKCQREFTIGLNGMIDGFLQGAVSTNHCRNKGIII